MRTAVFDARTTSVPIARFTSLRWAAAGVREGEKQFRRIIGRVDLVTLVIPNERWRTQISPPGSEAATVANP